MASPVPHSSWAFEAYKAGLSLLVATTVLLLTWGVGQSIMKRACALESKSESLILRTISERVLSDAELNTLGLFRQANQSVRESIRENVDCALGSRHAAYRLLNHILPIVASSLSRELPAAAPPAAYRLFP